MKNNKEATNMNQKQQGTIIERRQTKKHIKEARNNKKAMKTKKGGVVIAVALPSAFPRT